MNGARGFSLRDDAVEWLYSLHNNVNRERGTPQITKEECDALYGERTAADMNADVAALTAALSIATQTGSVDPIAVRSWKASLGLIRRLVGV
jgi:hypothetical protein